jgi:hypothetical protein
VTPDGAPSDNPEAATSRSPDDHGPRDPAYDQCMRSEAPSEIGVFLDFVDWLANRAPRTVVLPVPAVIGPQ